MVEDLRRIKAKVIEKDFRPWLPHMDATHGCK
jgi:hypothetical protein